MPETVAVAEQVNVAPLAIVSVADVAGAVIATLLTLVAVAAPRIGATKVWGPVQVCVAPSETGVVNTSVVPLRTVTH